MRKVLMILLAALLAVMIPLAGAAGGITEKNEETGYSLVIQDDAGLLDSAELAQVQEAMRPILAYANVGFLTRPSGDSMSGNSASKAMNWGYDAFGNTRFTVFIIDMSRRHLDIYASPKLSDTLTSAEENSITDNVYKLASNGDYGACAAKAFNQIEWVLKGEKIPTPMKYISNALIALIAAMLAAYVLISGWARKEQAVTMPNVVKGAAIGAATVVTANTLKKVVHHESSKGGHGGGFGGGGGGGFSGGSSGGHGF